jgi:hypothetical protein
MLDCPEHDLTAILFLFAGKPLRVDSQHFLKRTPDYPLQPISSEFSPIFWASCMDEHRALIEGITFS